MALCHVSNISLRIGVQLGRYKGGWTSTSFSEGRKKRWTVSICACATLVLLTLLGGTHFSSQQSVMAGPQRSSVVHGGRAASSHSRAVGEQQAPPAIAYLIMASKHGVEQLQRLLLAVYHPHNVYLLHLDAEAPPQEHQGLAQWVQNEAMFQECGNVQLFPQPNLITYTGPTMLATTLQGMAILLKRNNWRWFINLSASDFPLVTQDDILYVLSKVDAGRNFLALWPRLDWKVSQRTEPIVVDPALSHNQKQGLEYLPAKRADPTTFTAVTGSAWVTLSRPFVEYVIMGWENLPRLALMYFTNTVSSPEGYLHTVLCNSGFNGSLINTDLRHVTWDTPPKQHPRTLLLRDYADLANSTAMFARKFNLNASESLPLLDWIDAEMLGRTEGGFSSGGWCHQADKERFRRRRGLDAATEGWRWSSGARSRTKCLGVEMPLAAPIFTETSPPTAGPAEALEGRQEGGMPTEGLLDTGTTGVEGDDEVEIRSAASGVSGNSDKASAFGPGRLTGQWRGSARGPGKLADTVGETAETASALDGSVREVGRSDGGAHVRKRQERGADASADAAWVFRDLERGAAEEQLREFRRLALAFVDSKNGGSSKAAGERFESVTAKPEATAIAGKAEFPTSDKEGPQDGLENRPAEETVTSAESRASEEMAAARRGCDRFDGTFFLSPTKRVYELENAMATAIGDSQGDLCAEYHKIVVRKSPM